MASIMEILQLCRLCLVKEQVNVPIFDEQGDIRQIFLKITACLPVKVSKEDKLPKKICDGCLYKLELLYEFWNTTTNAEKQLLSWLSAAGLDPDTKTTEDAMAVVSQTQIVPKEEPNTDLPDETQSFLMDQPQLPIIESVDFAYQGTNFEAETSLHDVPEKVDLGNTVTDGEPAAKRPRRAAAASVAAATAKLAAETDSDDDEDVDDPGDPTVTKTEDDSEEEEEEEGEDAEGGEEDEDEDEDDEEEMEPPEPDFVDVSQDQLNSDQPGPSGIGKPGDAQNVYTCEACGKTLQTPLKLRLHKRMHRQKCIPCPKCSKLFVFQSQLNKHEKTCLRDPSNVFNCAVCQKELKSQHRYDRHMKAHKNEYDFHCNICSVGFSSSNAMLQHKQNIHFGIRHSCPHCGKVFTQMSYLKHHMTTHNLEFTDKKTPQDHAFDGEMLKYVCDICGKVYRYLDTFQTHMRNHKNEKPYVCPNCPKSFVAKAYLRRHIRRHANEKPYVCELCNKAFTEKNKLKIHVKLHEGILPHKCDICGKQFVTAYSLKLHYRKHEELVTKTS